MDKYVVRGGKPLFGDITIGGAKNAGLATLYMHTALTPADQKEADPALLPGKAPRGTRHFEFEGDDWSVLGDLIGLI